MLTLNNITKTLDEKTNTDDTVAFEICEENQPLNSTKWLMDNTEINNPDNVNIFDWIYNYLINKYGRDEVILIISTKSSCSIEGEIFANNLYIKLKSKGLPAMGFAWLLRMKKKN